MDVHRRSSPTAAAIRVCADDFGLNQGVNQAILDLCRKGRLDAVSCMVVGEACAEDADKLLNVVRDAETKIEIGLHITLTEFRPLGAMPSFAPEDGFPSINQVLLAGLRRRMPVSELHEEITRQITRFKALFGVMPDFIDGHQHVHLVPGLGRILHACEQDWRGETTWVRACACPPLQLPRLPTAAVKSAVLSLLSHRLHRQYNWPRNRWFYGVNTFELDQDFGQLMEAWRGLAAAAGDTALIMVHPGAPTKDDQDVIALRRPQEWDALRIG